MTATLDRDLLAAMHGAMRRFDPYAGEVPAGRVRNFLGVLQPDDIRSLDEAVATRTRHPGIAEGEGFLEYYSTLRSIERARDRYTMVSLGAHYGGPLVNAALMVRRLRPMPVKLIAIEGDPFMSAMLRRHFPENGIDVDDHCLINAVVGTDNKPNVFTTANVRTGMNGVVAAPARELLLAVAAQNNLSAPILRRVLTRMSIAIEVPFDGGTKGRADIVSTVTIADIAGPLDHIDYLEIDIQHAEEFVIPTAIETIDRKVGWIHLGTHSSAVHARLAAMFRDHDWELVFDFPPLAEVSTVDGPFRVGDGVIAAANRRIQVPSLKGRG
jgi:FkbM family methyltransferase